MRAPIVLLWCGLAGCGIYGIGPTVAYRVTGPSAGPAVGLRAQALLEMGNSTVFVGPDGGVLAVWGGHFLPDFGLRGLVATTLDTSGVANFFAASIAASGGTREPVTGAASTGLIGGIQGCGGKAVSGELGLRWRDGIEVFLELQLNAILYGAGTTTEGGTPNIPCNSVGPGG